MTPGIICIETEWEHTIRENRRHIYTKPLLEFVEKMRGCKVIYRRVATWNELAYYLNRFNLREYDDYRIFYFSFHGNDKGIFLEGERGEDSLVTLSDLITCSSGIFTDRVVHFSSCETFDISRYRLDKFKEESGALLLSGYSTSVDESLSAINDIAYFDQLLRLNYSKTELDISKREIQTVMKKYFGELKDHLGFVIV